MNETHTTNGADTMTAILIEKAIEEKVNAFAAELGYDKIFDDADLKAIKDSWKKQLREDVASKLA